MVTIKKLKNGVRVVLEPIPYVRSISFGIWVGNGSRNETPEENGISHFIEHMLFKGTEKRTARQIAEEMDSVGGQINAYTTKEYTCYHTRVLDKHIDRALSVMGDMFFHSLFSQTDIQKECNVILEEINMYEDAPEELVHEALHEKIWSESALGFPILGHKKTIEGMTTEHLHQYFLKNYHTENTVLSVAGNFSEDEILEKLSSIFGSWHSTAPYQPHLDQAQYQPSLVLREKSIEQLHLVLLYPGIQRDHPQKYAVSLLQTIFGGGMSSRLFQKIREEHGLTYSIYSFVSAYRDTGIFGVSASMNPSQATQVLQLVKAEIADLKITPISEKLLEVTKEQMISNFIIGTESTANRMTSNGTSVLLRNHLLTTEEIIQSIEKITPADVEEASQMIFDESRVSLSAVGNAAGLAQFSDWSAERF